MSNKSQSRLAFRYVMTVVGLICAALIVSCTKKDEVPGDTFTFPNAEWDYDAPVLFNEEGDSIPGNVIATVVSLRHTNDYPYANIWLELAYMAGDTVAADTFNMVLADNYGRWLGSGSGPVVTKTDTLRLRHNPVARTSFRLRHIMRVDKVPEVEQVSLSFITGPRIPDDTQSEDELTTEDNNDQ